MGEAIKDQREAETRPALVMGEALRAQQRAETRRAWVGAMAWWVGLLVVVPAVLYGGALWFAAL